jgi:hypothetical protein
MISHGNHRLVIQLESRTGKIALNGNSFAVCRVFSMQANSNKAAAKTEAQQLPPNFYASLINT